MGPPPRTTAHCLPLAAGGRHQGGATPPLQVDFDHARWGLAVIWAGKPRPYQGETMLFLTRLHQTCQRLADKPAIELIDGAERRVVTYGELETAVLQTITYLQRLGVQPGDRVAIQLPKCYSFILLHLATMRLGAISLPLNPAYPADELRYFLADAGCRLFFGDETNRATAEQAIERCPAMETAVFWTTNTHFVNQLPPAAPAPSLPSDPHATALMIYTSGTTGRPKGAQSSHANLTANLDGLHTAWGWQEADVLLHVLPIFHVHGLMVALHGALHAGATAVLLPHFDADQTLTWLEKRRCTVFMGVPTIHRRLVDAPRAKTADLSHMRLLTSGSDRLPDDLFQQFQNIFGHTLLERYGMTETGMNLSNPLHGDRRIGSVGLPLPGVLARIADPATDQPLADGEVGEVQIQGPHVFTGYWQMPEKTAESFTADGWLKTGDLGFREPDGYFTLQGRSKDLIITGGLNVYPPEIERVLIELPQIAAVAVIGCPDAEWGERVTAVVVLAPGAQLTAVEMSDHCRKQLAAYKIPRQVLFAESLPRNALGKVQKSRLRETICS